MQRLRAPDPTDPDPGRHRSLEGIPVRCFFSLPVLASQLVRLRHIASWFKMSTSRRSHRARGRSMPDERGRSADSASDGGRGAFEHASEGEYGANEGEAGQSYEQGFNGRTLCALGWLVLLLSCTMVCIPS